DQTERQVEKRLAGALNERIQKLEAVRGNKHFPDLPQDLQDFVKVTLAELTAFRSYSARVAEAERELDALRLEDSPRQRRAKTGPVPPLEGAARERGKKKREGLFGPPAYQAAWAPTAVVREAQARLQELGAFRKSVEDTRRGYERLPAKLRE